MTDAVSVSSLKVQPLVETRAQPLTQAPKLEQSGNPFFSKPPELAGNLSSSGRTQTGLQSSAGTGKGLRIDLSV